MSNSLGPHGLQDAYHLYVESKKKKKSTNEHIYKTEINSQKKTLMVTTEEKELGEELGAWD